MELVTLKLLVTDADLDILVKRFLPADAPVINLTLTVADGSVVLAGDYPTRLLNIGFTTTWEPSVEGRLIRVRLGRIRVVGIPIVLLRGLFLRGFQKVAKDVPGARVEDDTLFLDLDALLASKGIPLKSNLKTIRCESGRMILEG